jgi:hypothetical protein
MAEITWLIQPNGCWLCNSHAKDKDGYACCKRNGKSQRIHRLFYQGEIPPNHVVRHTCDQPACINPDHLIIGTHAENVADRVARNRSASGITNGRAKLTEEDVIAIYTNITETQTVLANRYNVDRKVVRDIKQKKKWVAVIDSYLSSMVHL